MPPTKDPKERMRAEQLQQGAAHGPRRGARAAVSVSPGGDDDVRSIPSSALQTPAQLLEAIHEVRREIDGKASPKTSCTRSLFVVEKDEGLQDTFRVKFKELGYRVFIAADPTRALDRYRQQPYDALVVDAGTVGQDGLLLFDRVLGEAKRQGQFCAGILILSERQRDWVDKIESHPGVSILVRPVTLKQLSRELSELLALQPPD